MNNLVAFLDGGWHFMRNLFFFTKGFAPGAPEHIRSQAIIDFQDALTRGILKVLNQFPETTNIVLSSEGGSWRKEVPIPDHLVDTTYKGNRTKDDDIDWNAAYDAYDSWTESISKYITHCRGKGLEGDDWAWHWSRRLNSEGTDVIIWSSDADLKQLVQTTDKAFTVWYNTQSGLVRDSRRQYKPTGILWEDMMVGGGSPVEDRIDVLARKAKQSTSINPDSIVIDKVLCGDAGDNIKPIVQCTKGGRTYGFTRKDASKLPVCESIEDFLASGVVDNVYNLKKSRFPDLDKETIAEQLEYNMRLVRLSNRDIPKSLQEYMAGTELLQAPVEDIKANYKMLLPVQSGIEDLFAGAV